MNGLSLGIDAGSSSARWQMLGENGQEIGSGRVGPVSAIDLLRESEAGATTANLRELLSQASAAGRPMRVVAGVTGLGDSAEDVLAMRTTLASGLGIDVAAVTVLPDVYIAYLSAFEPGGGVLVYAGTGSIALHLTSRGEALRAGGTATCSMTPGRLLDRPRGSETGAAPFGRGRGEGQRSVGERPLRIARWRYLAAHKACRLPGRPLEGGDARARRLAGGQPRRP